MAIVRGRLGTWGSVAADVFYNDANSNVQRVVVDNPSGRSITFAVWLNADPNMRLLVTVLDNNDPAKALLSPAQIVGVPSEYTNIPSGTKYNPTELPIGDPRSTNFSFSYVG